MFLLWQGKLSTVQTIKNTFQKIELANQSVGNRHASGLSTGKPKRMKSLFLILYILSSQLGQQNANNNAEANATAIKGQKLKIVLSNHATDYMHSDSVLVILDKYDHSGAGIVKKKFYPGADHSFTVTGVPEGRYYATIKCLGVHHDYVEKVVRVVRDKDNTLKIKLEEAEDFSKDQVSIPGEKINLAKLSVTRN
jgi:hypothetical protein